MTEATTTEAPGRSKRTSISEAKLLAGTRVLFEESETPVSANHIARTLGVGFARAKAAFDVITAERAAAPAEPETQTCKKCDQPVSEKNQKIGLCEDHRIEHIAAMRKTGQRMRRLYADAKTMLKRYGDEGFTFGNVQAELSASPEDAERVLAWLKKKKLAHPGPSGALYFSGPSEATGQRARRKQALQPRLPRSRQTADVRATRRAAISSCSIQEQITAVMAAAVFVGTPNNAALMAAVETLQSRRS